MEGIEILISILVVIVWIIFLVKFFQMAADIRKLKKRIGQPDSDYYHYIGLAKEEHHLGNVVKEREYVMRAQCHAQTDEQKLAVQKMLDKLDNKQSDDNDSATVAPHTPAFAENLIGR